MEEEYEALKKEVEKLKAENASWGIDFNTVIQFRRKASSFEKEGKLHDAIDEYSKSVAFGENSKRLNLSNYVYDIERLIVLYNKTKQRDKLIGFLKLAIAKYPNYRDAHKWVKRLSSLIKTN